jgi:hypothetical protein
MDRYDLGEGSASAAANNAAKANAAEVGNALKAMAGTTGPAPVEPEPVETPSEEPAGPSPASEPTTGDDVDEPVSDDYDEEDVAEHPEESEPESPKTTDVPPAEVDDATKTWNQYKTDADRKKALAETKRYAAEQARLRKEAETRLAALEKKAPEAVPAPVPVVDQKEALAATTKALYETNPAFKTEADRLGQYRNVIVSRIEEIKTLNTETTANEAKLQRLQYRLEDLQADAKADPENFELLKKVDKTENEILRTENIINRDRSKLNRFESEKDRWLLDYRQSVDRLDQFVVQQGQRTAEEAQASARIQQGTAESEKEWTTTAPAVFDEFKVGKDPKQRATLNSRLLERAAAFFFANPGGNLGNGDIRAWMRAQVKQIVEGEYGPVRETAARAYVQAKKADATVPAPRGEKAVAAPEPGKRFSSKDADRQAQQAMKAVRLRA